jgi:hypothetical protein
MPPWFFAAISLTPADLPRAPYFLPAMVRGSAARAAGARTHGSRQRRTCDRGTYQRFAAPPHVRQAHEPVVRGTAARATGARTSGSRRRRTCDRRTNQWFAAPPHAGQAHEPIVRGTAPRGTDGRTHGSRCCPRWEGRSSQRFALPSARDRRTPAGSDLPIVVTATFKHTPPIGHRDGSPRIARTRSRTPSKIATEPLA